MKPPYYPKSQWWASQVKLKHCGIISVQGIQLKIFSQIFLRNLEFQICTYILRPTYLSTKLDSFEKNGKQCDVGSNKYGDR